MHTTDSSHATAIGISRKSSLVKIGGSLGIAGSFISLFLFLFALFGFSAAFMLAILPVAFGGLGTVLTIIGAILHKHEGEAETQPISAIFACTMAMVAGGIELQMWLSWPHPGM
jgi:hypothetical protein